jgi:hypothetical protein
MPKVRTEERAVSWMFHTGRRTAAFASAVLLLVAPAAMGADAVVSLTLVNADTDQDIGPLTHGMTLNLATLPTRNLNVRANTSPATVGSVKFGYNATSSFRIESGAPYALAGDAGGTDYHAWTPDVNPSSTIVATPYSEPNAAGTRGTALTVSFSVIDQAAQQVTTLSLFDSLTGEVLVPNIASQQKVEVSNLSSRCLNVSATTSPSVVGSVGFELTGLLTDARTSLSGTETNPPYSLLGDAGQRGCLAVGTQTVRATAYSLANRGGVAGPTLTRVFEIAAPPPPFAASVTSLSLVDSVTQQVLVPSLAANQTVTVADIGNKCLNLRATTHPSAVGSVAFDLTRPGGILFSSTENGTPYDMMGDEGHRGCLGLGAHSVVATPYELPSEDGRIGTALSRAFTLAGVSDADLLFLGDFDGSDPLRDSRDSTKSYNRECALSDSCLPTTEKVRGGARAFKLTLRESDPMIHNGTRAEIGRDTDASAHSHTEQWYGFSMFLPDTWQIDNQAGEIIAQWHSPNTDEAAAGEPGKSPPLSLYLNGDVFKIASIWDPKKVTQDNDPTIGTPKGGRATLWQGSVSAMRGKWVDWVFHVKWNYDGNGFVRVWKDGQQIVNSTGPNTYNDEGTIFFKYGIYKYGWNNNNGSGNTVKLRSLYVDELRYGDRYSSYGEVAPR